MERQWRAPHPRCPTLSYLHAQYFKEEELCPEIQLYHVPQFCRGQLTGSHAANKPVPGERRGGEKGAVGGEGGGEMGGVRRGEGQLRRRAHRITVREGGPVGHSSVPPAH